MFIQDTSRQACDQSDIYPTAEGPVWSNGQCDQIFLSKVYYFSKTPALQRKFRNTRVVSIPVSLGEMAFVSQIQILDDTSLNRMCARKGHLRHAEAFLRCIGSLETFSCRSKPSDLRRAHRLLSRLWLRGDSWSKGSCQRIDSWTRLRCKGRQLLGRGNWLIIGGRSRRSPKCHLDHYSRKQDARRMYCRILRFWLHPFRFAGHPTSYRYRSKVNISILRPWQCFEQLRGDMQSQYSRSR